MDYAVDGLLFESLRSISGALFGIYALRRVDPKVCVYFDALWSQSSPEFCLDLEIHCTQMQRLMIDDFCSGVALNCF